MNHPFEKQEGGERVEQGQGPAFLPAFVRHLGSLGVVLLPLGVINWWAPSGQQKCHIG